MYAIRSYYDDWPGNVRELEHLLMRASLKAARRGEARPLIRPEHLDLNEAVVTSVEASSAMTGLDTVPLPPDGLRMAVDSFQRQLIRQALADHDGNWSATARSLQLDRANLTRLARRLGLA